MNRQRRLLCVVDDGCTTQICLPSTETPGGKTAKNLCSCCRGDVSCVSEGFRFHESCPVSKSRSDRNWKTRIGKITRIRETVLESRIDQFPKSRSLAMSPQAALLLNREISCTVSSPEATSLMNRIVSFLRGPFHPCDMSGKQI